MHPHDIQVVRFRDILLVTAGMRIAYMDYLGLIDIPRGVEGERIIAEFISNLVDKYLVSGDVNFDEYVESAILTEYGPKGVNV